MPSIWRIFVYEFQEYQGVYNLVPLECWKVHESQNLENQDVPDFHTSEGFDDVHPIPWAGYRNRCLKDNDHSEYDKVPSDSAQCNVGLLEFFLPIFLDLLV
jgi:hypothetical protein